MQPLSRCISSLFTRLSEALASSDDHEENTEGFASQGCTHSINTSTSRCKITQWDRKQGLLPPLTVCHMENVGANNTSKMSP